jgi:hypothetical protein
MVPKPEILMLLVLLSVPSWTSARKLRKEEVPEITETVGRTTEVPDGDRVSECVIAQALMEEQSLDPSAKYLEMFLDLVGQQSTDAD